MPLSTTCKNTSELLEAPNFTTLQVDNRNEHDVPNDHAKNHDFFWTYTEEPHRTRRQAIIKAHPEVEAFC